MRQTYNPLLEIVELPRFRLTALRAPAIGTALVLERPEGHPLLVWPGDRVPDPWTGHYRRLYRVDTANHGLAFTVETPSADPAFPFAVEVRLACRVTDPVVIARDRIHDMTATLQTSLAAIVRQSAARFDALEPAAAETAIIGRLDTAHRPACVELSGFSVAVATRDTAEIMTTRRKIRVEEMRRESLRPVVAGGRDEMLAHIMALTDGDPTPVLDREQEQRESEMRGRLDALRIMGSGKDLEEFNRWEISKQAANTFFPGEGPGTLSRRGSIREKIERRSPPAIDGGGIVGENPPAEPGEHKADSPVGAQPSGAADGQRPGRLRGTLGSSRRSGQR